MLIVQRIQDENGALDEPEEIDPEALKVDLEAQVPILDGIVSGNRGTFSTGMVDSHDTVLLPRVAVGRRNGGGGGSDGCNSSLFNSLGFRRFAGRSTETKRARQLRLGAILQN